MKKAVFIFVLGFVCASVGAQTGSFVPTKKGMECIYKYFDAKGKPEIVKGTKEEAYLRQTVVDVTQEGDATHITMSCESNLLNNIEHAEQIIEDLKNLQFRIQDNVLYADNIMARTSALYSSEFEKMSAGDMKVDVNIEAQQLQMPLSLSVGQTLADEDVTKTTIKMTGVMNMTFYTTTSYKNRKVEAIEDVNTPAGTFNCFKISYDLEVNMDMGMMKQGSAQKMIEWLSPEIGMVKTEQYDKKGKLSSSTVLSEVKNK